MFDFTDEALHQMTFFVEMFIILSAFFAVFTRRNNCFSLFFSDEKEKLLSIIRFVGNNTFEFIADDQGFCLCDVVPLTTSQQKAQWVAQRINIHMDFGAETTSATPKCLIFLPVTFFLRHQQHRGVL